MKSEDFSKTMYIQTTSKVTPVDIWFLLRSTILLFSSRLNEPSLTSLSAHKNYLSNQRSSERLRVYCRPTIKYS